MSKRKQRGSVIRVSEEIEKLLKKKRRKNESFDRLLRRLFCIDDGTMPADDYYLSENYPILLSFWVIHGEDGPMLFKTEADAKGAAVLMAVKAKTKKLARIIHMREVIK